MKNRFQLALLSSPILFFLLVVGFRRPLSDDESIFIYGAQQLNRGDYFLTNFWDHKGPLLYWLNWLSVNLPLPNFLGVALMQGTLTSLSLYFLLHHLKSLGMKIQVIASISFITNVTLIAVILNMNTTEGWSLPFQLICYSVLLVLQIRPELVTATSRKVATYGMLIGLSFTSLILIRVNNGFGVFIATLFIIISLKKYREIFAIAWSSSVGIILLSVGLIYTFSGNLQSLFDRYFTYNSDYSSGMSFSRRLFGLNYFIFNYIKSPIFIFCVALLIFYFYTRNGHHQPIIIFGVLVGVDFLSQTLSGRGNRQYIPATIASLLLLSILVMHLLNLELKSHLVVIAIAIFTSYSISALSLDNLEASWHSGYKNQISDSQFIQSLGTEDSSLYYYGPSPQSLVRSGTKSISQFIFLAPALSAFSRDQERFALKLTEEVRSQKPKYIVRDKNSCPFESQACYEGNEQYLSESKALGSLRNWILDNYKFTKESGSLEVWSKI